MANKCTTLNTTSAEIASISALAGIGSKFYVDSVNGNDLNPGTSDSPMASINKAVAACTAGQNDVIYCLPGHYEDLADTSTSGAIDLDVADISLVGLGAGNKMARIDFNHADSDFLVSADNILIQNMHFEATVTGVKIGVSIVAGSDYCTIKGCKFTVETTTTDEFLVAVNIGVVSGTTIECCKFDAGLGGAAHAILMKGASTGCYIRDNDIVGDYSVACIGGDTTLSTDYRIERNLLVNGNANALGTVAAIVLLTGSLGVIRDNTMFADVATHLLVCTADTTLYSNNLVSDDSGTGSTTALTSASIVASADA